MPPAGRLGIYVDKAYVDKEIVGKCLGHQRHILK